MCRHVIIKTHVVKLKSFIAQPNICRYMSYKTWGNEMSPGPPENGSANTFISIGSLSPTFSSPASIGGVLDSSV